MKAIIFDMGGVLVDLDMDACRNAFKYDLGFDEIDTILDPCHQKGIIGDLEEGLVTADEFRKYVLERSREGATDVDVNEAFAKILVGIEPSKIELLKKLAEDYLLPSIPPSIRVFSNESALRIRWPKYWSFSFSISPSNEHSELVSFRMDWLDLLEVQGTLKSLHQHHSSKASILRRSAFFTVQLSHPYMTTGKTIALT